MIRFLRWINAWLDEVILELSKPFTLVGFIFGTVDIFTHGTMASQQWFEFGWSALQAVTIDSLFFIVWYRVFTTPISRDNWFQKMAYLLIGVILGTVVMATNGIITDQQISNLVDSQAAMSDLYIDPRTFALVRAVLVVFVTVMMAYVYQTRDQAVGKGRMTNTTDEPRVTTNPNPNPDRPSFWSRSWSRLTRKPLGSQGVMVENQPQEGAETGATGEDQTSEPPTDDSEKAQQGGTRQVSSPVAELVQTSEPSVDGPDGPEMAHSDSTIQVSSPVGEPVRTSGPDHAGDHEPSDGPSEGSSKKGSRKGRTAKVVSLEDRLVKESVMDRLRQGEPMRALAAETGVSYSTIKRWNKVVQAETMDQTDRLTEGPEEGQEQAQEA